jgi:hypothetical protein
MPAGTAVVDPLAALSTLCENVYNLDLTCCLCNETPSCAKFYIMCKEGHGACKACLYEYRVDKETDKTAKVHEFMRSVRKSDASYFNALWERKVDEAEARLKCPMCTSDLFAAGKEIADLTRTKFAETNFEVDKSRDLVRYLKNREKRHFDKADAMRVQLEGMAKQCREVSRREQTREEGGEEEGEEEEEESLVGAAGAVAAAPAGPTPAAFLHAGARPPPQTQEAERARKAAAEAEANRKEQRARKIARKAELRLVHKMMKEELHFLTGNPMLPDSFTNGGLLQQWLTVAQHEYSYKAPQWLVRKAELERKAAGKAAGKAAAAAVATAAAAAAPPVQTQQQTQQTQQGLSEQGSVFLGKMRSGLLSLAADAKTLQNKEVVMEQEQPRGAKRKAADDDDWVATTKGEDAQMRRHCRIRAMKNQIAWISQEPRIGSDKQNDEAALAVRLREVRLTHRTRAATWDSLSPERKQELEAVEGKALEKEKPPLTAAEVKKKEAEMVEKFDNAIMERITACDHVRLWSQGVYETRGEVASDGVEDEDMWEDSQ